MTDHGDQIPIDATIDADAAAIERLRAAADEASANERSAAARDFVAQAREAQAEQLDAQADAASSMPRGSRRSWPIVLALFVGVQILAGGVFVALQSLQPEDQNVAATAAEPAVVPTVAAASPSLDATPTPPPTPTFPPTATAVPPTPEWRPVDGGPRWAPFTFVVSPGDGGVSLFAEPEGETLTVTSGGEPLERTWPSGAPVRFRVISGDPAREWVQVELPDDESTLAWVRSDELIWEASYRLVQIDVTANRLRVFEGNDVLFEAVIASGSLDEPTPPQQTWLVENAFGDAIADTPEFVFARSGDAAPLRLAIIEDEADLGRHITDGVVLIAEREANTVARAVIAGAKFEVIGRPVPPTPTPIPTPTPRTEVARADTPSTGGGTSPGCPRGTQGSPPECYRVVAREELPGECPGLQLAIEDFCMSLGGDPEVVDGSERCPEQAPRRIGDFCYTVQGRIPIVEGDCPASSTEVDGECREFVVP